MTCIQYIFKFKFMTTSVIIIVTFFCTFLNCAQSAPKKKCQLSIHMSTSLDIIVSYKKLQKNTFLWHKRAKKEVSNFFLLFYRTFLFFWKTFLLLLLNIFLLFCLFSCVYGYVQFIIRCLNAWHKFIKREEDWHKKESLKK